VTCSRCRRDNPSQAKFCLGCGARLALGCPRCATALPADAAFCMECGHVVAAATGPGFQSLDAFTPRRLAERILTSRGALEGERKLVTVLFADLKGSMELIAARDAEEARALLDPVLTRMMRAVHRYDGTVNQVMGDGIMALFGAPLAHEDHAVRACYAALHMQESVRAYADEIRRSHGVPVQIRVGLNSGEVVVRAIGGDLRMDYTAVGLTTHLAARMEQMATPGSTLLTAETLALADAFVEVEPLGAMPIKGLDVLAPVYALTGTRPARSRLHAMAARSAGRCVGRDAELGQLAQALEQAWGGRGQVVAVLGDAGVGKSRLCREFLGSDRARDALVLETGSVSYGGAVPFLPVIELLRAYCRIEPRDDARTIREKVTGKVFSLDRRLDPILPALLALLDAPAEGEDWERLDPTQRRQQTLDAVRRLALRESQRQPLVIVFEDLHWIDAGTQALIDLLVESLPSARLLLLLSYRPEYRHTWASKTYYRQLRIDPLPPARADELLAFLLGEDPSLRPPEAAPHRADRGQRAVPRGERARTGGEPGARRRSGPLSPGAVGAGRPHPGDRAGHPRRAHRSAERGGQASAPDRVGHRQERAARPARSGGPAPRGRSA
jgi:class 3 adenylate cyclase